MFPVQNNNYHKFLLVQLQVMQEKVKKKIGHLTDLKLRDSDH